MTLHSLDVYIRMCVRIMLKVLFKMFIYSLLSLKLANNFKRYQDDSTQSLLCPPEGRDTEQDSPDGENELLYKGNTLLRRVKYMTELSSFNIPMPPTGRETRIPEETEGF